MPRMQVACCPAQALTPYRRAVLPSGTTGKQHGRLEEQQQSAANAWMPVANAEEMAACRGSARKLGAVQVALWLGSCEEGFGALQPTATAQHAALRAVLRARLWQGADGRSGRRGWRACGMLFRVDEEGVGAAAVACRSSGCWHPGDAAGASRWLHWPTSGARYCRVCTSSLNCLWEDKEQGRGDRDG